MRALVRPADGSWSVVDRQPPTVEAHQVLVGVRAAALNQADLLMRDGTYVPDDPSWNVDHDRVGFEMAGVAVEVGADVVGVLPGDRVMGQAGGACAEYVAVDHRLLLPAPAHLTWAESAGLPSALMTGFDALVRVARLRRGEHVLVLGATTGTGSMCVQLARLLGAGRITGSTRQADRIEAVRRSGADAVVLAAEVERWPSGLRDEMRPDVVLDLVGGPLLGRAVAATAVRGRVVQIGRLGGSRSEIDLDVLALNRVSLTGTTFRGRRPAELHDLVARIAGAGLLTRLTPHVSQVVPLERAHEAFSRFEAGTDVGKVVLHVADDHASGP